MPVIINQYIKSNRKAFIIDNFFHYWNKHNHVCTGSILIKTEVIKKIGGFRNDLRITEDLELWILLSTYGLIGFIPKVLFTSDGGIVTKKIGWLKKNIVRWESTPTIDVWQKRIIKRIDKNKQEDFNFVKGRIIKNLTYSLIMAGKHNLSREQISKYKDYLPKDKMSGLMSIISENKYFWFLFAKIIKMREYLK